jgi:hypothetical protein
MHPYLAIAKLQKAIEEHFDSAALLWFVDGL